MTTADQSRDEALNVVQLHAAKEWWVQAERALHRLCLRQSHLTSEDLWREIPREYRTHEPKAIGAILRKAAGLWISPTTTYVKGTRKESHSRPILRWRSLVFDNNTKETR